MIERIRITSFQSITDATIELAPLTVLVGPSSSGKSAFIRAVKLLANNARGTSFIQHGKPSASVTATTANGSVTITRSRSTSSTNEYVLAPSNAQPTHFTKLNGQTPEEVSAFLALPDPSLTFASQFDSPYLLADAPSQAASTLASLTNAHLIFQAAKQANQIKLQSSQSLRIRTNDLEAIRTRIPEFKSLRTKRESLAQAESILTEAHTLQDDITALERLSTAIEHYTALRDQNTVKSAQRATYVIDEAQSIQEDLTALVNAQLEIMTTKRLIESYGAAAAEQSTQLLRINASLKNVKQESAKAFYSAMIPHQMDDHINTKKAAVVAATVMEELS